MVRVTISLAIPAFVIVSLLAVPVSGEQKLDGSIMTLEGMSRESAGPNQPSGELIVRIYNDWQKDRRAYKLISIPLKGFSVSFDEIRKAFPGIKDSAAVVILGREQKDKAVSAVIGDSFFAESYKKGKQFFMFPLHTGTDSVKKWSITDAMGFAFPGASVEIFVHGVSDEYPRIYLYTAKTDEQGQLKIPEPAGELRFFSFVVSEPSYGIALVERYIHENRELIVPLVSKTAEAYERSIQGVVVDPEGYPVNGVVVECYNIRTLGEGLINALHGWSYKSLTDRKGAFSLYLPNENPRDERGYLIPPKSQYHVRIEAPRELGLLPYVKPIENGQDVLISLERGGRFRTLIFEDDDGPITDPKILRYIGLTINRPDGSRLSMGYDDFKDGGIFPPGEYHASRLGMEECDFESLTVDEQSPDELIFRLPERILYYGQVVHGRTGEPMPEAFVIGFNSKAKGNFSMITDDQWKAIYALPDDLDLNDPAVKPICDIYGVKKIVRTDEQGCFQISIRPGEIYGFIAFQEDYLGLMHRRHALVPDEYRQAEIPVMKLYPAATVLIEACTKAKHISICPRWIIDENENPAWVREFLATDDRRESLFTYYSWIEQNKVQSFHVPAGLNLRVKLDTPYDKQFCPIEIAEVIHLAQGQVLDLGRHEFKTAIEIYVQVINSQGRAIEGVPVRMRCDGNAWSVSHNTDESGIARFNVVPNSDGEFGVLYRDKSSSFQNETIPFHVGGDSDSGLQFTFQLSDEILELLFKSNSL